MEIIIKLFVLLLLNVFICFGFKVEHTELGSFWINGLFHNYNETKYNGK